MWRCKKKGLDVLLMFVFYKAIISELLLFLINPFFKKKQVFLNFLCNYTVLKTDPMLMSHYSYGG